MVALHRGPWFNRRSSLTASFRVHVDSVCLYARGYDSGSFYRATPFVSEVLSPGVCPSVYVRLSRTCPDSWRNFFLGPVAPSMAPSSAGTQFQGTVSAGAQNAQGLEKFAVFD